jgi:hypothetical protein
VTLLEDQVALRRLADVYCSAVDDGDAELMASLFAPGGRLVVYRPGDWPGSGEPLRRWDGIEGFRKLLSVLGESYVRWVHFLGNHWVEVDGDRAHGQAYLFACHLRERDGREEEEVAVIRYVDHYVRTADGWRFEERNACRQWTTVRPVQAAQHEIDAVLHGRADTTP